VQHAPRDDPGARLDLADLVAAVIGVLRRSSLFWFLALGGAIFAIAPREATSAKISISPGDVRALHAAQATKLGVRELPASVASEVDARAIEDEVLYREALRLGLDRDDALVRQHLVQKMLMLAEDLSGASRPPTDAEVRAYFDAHREAYRMPARLRVVHVFATTRERALANEEHARAWRGEGAPPFGDAFPNARELEDDQEGLAAAFGDAFAQEAAGLAPGAWSKPVQSRFGWHLVRLVAREPARLATYEDVGPRLGFELQVHRRHDAVNAFLKSAMARYEVDVGGARVRDLPEARRLAVRTQPSAED
jgi:hypothetical protein